MCVVAVVMHYCTVSPSRSSRAKYRLSLSPGVQYCNGGEERINLLVGVKKIFMCELV